jgi:hypothetical protein
MEKKVLLAVVLFWVAILLSFCAKEVPQEITWTSSLGDALTTAQEQNKHIIAEFWSDG